MFDGASDHTDAKNYLGGNGTNDSSTTTTIALAETKTQGLFEKTSHWTISPSKRVDWGGNVFGFVVKKVSEGLPQFCNRIVNPCHLAGLIDHLVGRKADRSPNPPLPVFCERWKYYYQCFSQIAKA